MLSVRTTWLAVAALCLALGSARAAPPVGLKGAGADADKWLMDNADFAVAINVKQLAGSDLVSKGNAREWRDWLVKTEPKVAAVFDAAGVDPLKDVDSVLFSGSVGSKGADAKGVVVIRGRFDPDKVIEAVRKKSDKAEVIKDGDVSMIKLKVQEHDAFGAFANKNTLIVTQSKESTSAWVKNGGKSESKMTTALKSALSGFKGTETMTFAMALTDDVRKMVTRVPQLAAAGSKLQTVTAALSVTDEVNFQLTASTADAKSAKQVQNALNVLKGLGEVMISDDDDYGQMLSTVFSEGKVTVDGTDVRLTLKADKSQLEKAGKKKTSAEQ